MKQLLVFLTTTDHAIPLEKCLHVYPFWTSPFIALAYFCCHGEKKVVGEKLLTLVFVSVTKFPRFSTENWVNFWRMFHFLLPHDVASFHYSEQPIFTCQAHVFHIDPKTKRTWITASSKAISVSFFFDSSRNLYRIISVEGTKVSDITFILNNIK